MVNEDIMSNTIIQQTLDRAYDVIINQLTARCVAVYEDDARVYNALSEHFDEARVAVIVANSFTMSPFLILSLFEDGYMTLTELFDDDKCIDPINDHIVRTRDGQQLLEDAMHHYLERLPNVG